MKKHFSAGGVVINNNREVFLTYKKARSEWSLPKGGMEQGETKLEAALREIKEETGYQYIESIQKTPIHTTTWTFIHEETGKQEQKTVYYFLFRLLGKKRVKTRQMKEEGFSGDWFSFEKALKRAAFGNIKEVLRKAMKMQAY